MKRTLYVEKLIPPFWKRVASLEQIEDEYIPEVSRCSATSARERSIPCWVLSVLNWLKTLISGQRLLSEHIDGYSPRFR